MGHALSAIGSVDPDRVYARVRLLEDWSERGEVFSIVGGAFACLARLKSVDFSALERAAAHKSSTELWGDVEGDVDSVWSAIQELEHALQPLIALHEKRRAADIPSEDFEFDLESEAGAEGSQSAVGGSGPMTPLERIGETAWATCFMLQSEITGFRRRLPQLSRLKDGWELVSELQDHIGHVKAALNAILTGVYASLPPAADESPNEAHSLELMASLELRVRVFELRDHVLRIERQMSVARPEDWEKYLRLARQFIEGFMYGPAFGWMRAGDKRTFIVQQRSIGELLEMWSPLRAVPAKHTISNLARYLEALEIINQREVLLEHDRERLSIVASHLESARTTENTRKRRNGIATALAALAELQGRDESLDKLLERTLDPSSPVPVDEIQVRCRSLLEQLGGSTS